MSCNFFGLCLTSWHVTHGLLSPVPKAEDEAEDEAIPQHVIDHQVSITYTDGICDNALHMVLTN